LTDALVREGSRYSFFQAVRLLQSAFPDAAPVGGPGPAAREVVRLRPSLDLAFAPSDLSGIRQIQGPDGTRRYEVTTRFLGIYGPGSPLPSYFTEELLAQDEQSLSRGFLDLFHHRLLSFLYRAWEKYRYDVQFRSGADPLSRRLLALIGAARLPEGHQVPAVRLLGVAGIFTRNPKSADGLRGILRDYFEGLSVELESCVPRWIPVPEDQQNRLGLSGCRLGKDLTLGERVLDRSGTFRITLGELSLKDYASFLPGGARRQELRELTDLFNTEGLDYELELRLREDQIPDARLASEEARLGLSTWLGRCPGMETRVTFLMEGWVHGRG
jgi:type VI secretion system protein ImpH